MTIKHITYIVILIVSIFVGIRFNPFGEIEHPPGVLVDQYPKSFDIKKMDSWEYEAYTITPLKSVVVHARILGTQKYYSDRESDICPIDLALGWGPMSDSKVLDNLNIYQSQRWFFWETDRLPIPEKDIQAYSSNMHMVPSNDEILNKLENLKTGNIVKIEGYLINAKGYDGWEWKSSMSWIDAGGGACELIWIKNIEKIH